MINHQAGLPCLVLCIDGQREFFNGEKEKKHTHISSPHSCIVPFYPTQAQIVPILAYWKGLDVSQKAKKKNVEIFYTRVSNKEEKKTVSDGTDQTVGSRVNIILTQK